jgi:O-antigen ligase
MTSLDSQASQAATRTAGARRMPPGPALSGPLLLIVIAGLTAYAGLTDSFPKLFSLLLGAGLLIYAVERAPEWIVAVLLVGQFILHWISAQGGGEISRDNPLSGPLLPMYLLGGGLVLMRILLSRRKEARPHWPLSAQILMLCAALLGVMIAAGLLYSPAPMSARTKTLGYVAFNLAPSALVLLLIDSEERLIRLIRAVIVIGLVMAVITHLGHDTAEGGAGAGLYNIGEGKQGLAIGGARFAGGTWFARRLDLVLISLLITATLSRNRLWLVAMFALTPYVVYLLFLSGARGAMAGGAVAFMVVLTLLTAMARSGRALRSVTFVLLLIVLAVAAGGVRSEALSQDIVDRYTVLEHPFQSDASGADRLQYWRSAWDTFEEHPFVGIGAGGWGMVWNKQDYRDFPHNIFLEILCEEGLVGGLLFSLFFFGSMRLVWTVLRNPFTTSRGRTLAIWAIGILTFAGLDAQLSGDIQTNDYIWMAAAVICVLARIAASTQMTAMPEAAAT